MDNKDREQEFFFCGCLTAFLLAGVGWMFLLLMLTGCSPRIVETVRTEYVYRDRVQVDTTVLRDSIRIREVVQGDTVRITEYRDHLVYQYKLLAQTDTVIVRDSVAVERPVEVEVEKPLTGWQRFRIGAFWWLLALAAGLAGWTFRKPIVKLIKTVL